MTSLSLFNCVESQFRDVLLLLCATDYICFMNSEFTLFTRFVLANSDDEEAIHTEGIMSSLLILFNCLI